MHPPRGFFEFSAQRRYIFTAILYISRQTTPQRSVRPSHLRNGAGRRPRAPASSGLSIHGGGAGMSSCRGSRPANQQRNLSQALQRALETFTQRNQSKEVSGVCFPRVLSTSPGLANALNGRSRLLLKTTCQPASCRAFTGDLRLTRHSPVACTNCPSDGLDCCLLTICASSCANSINMAPWLRAVCIFCVFYAYVVAVWRCRWALLARSWGAVAMRSCRAWRRLVDVMSSWWFSAFFHGGGWL